MRRTKKIKFLTAGLIILFSALAIQTANAQTVWLDQLDLSTATQGFGTPRSNQSVDGNRLSIAGKTFGRGFGSHSESSLTVLLEGKAVSFSALVGIDDEVKGRQPAAEFIVYGDNKKLWSSGTMHLGDTARSCRVDLAGVRKLELVVTDGGNGNYYDHVDWVDAKFA
ncbi:MAG: Alpha-galactosidase, partial [Bacteroidetes bacterium]|nr:Alpha-galactosidase [Bacteroidota bacterium]